MPVREGAVMKMKTVTSANNIWDREGFQMCGLGEKSKIIARIKYFRKISMQKRPFREVPKVQNDTLEYNNFF